MVRLDILLGQLGTCLPQNDPPFDKIFCPENLEMLENQKMLYADRIYLGDNRSAKLLREVPAELGSVVLLSDNAVYQAPAGALVFSLPCSLPSLFNRVSSALAQEVRLKTTAHQTFQQCWDDIAARRITGTGQIREALDHLPYPVGQFVQMAVLTFAKGGTGVDYNRFLSDLETIFPMTNMAVYQRNVLLLFTYEERTFRWESFRNDAIQSLLSQYDAYLSISNGSRNLSALYTLYILTKGIPSLAQQLNLEKGRRVFFYERYSIYTSIDLCAQRFVELYGIDDIIYLVHPAIIHLTRYDRDHNADLRHLLYHYLLNDRNLVKTADVLYMHRNTVINKVRKISELVDLDLEDGTLRHRLIFSCQVIQYYEKIMNLPLKL